MRGFRQRLAYDPETGAYHDRTIRYMLVRPDALMGLFARLEGDARTAAFAAFADSITEHGRHSAQSYGAPDDRDRLLAIIAETAPQLGWGLWRFEPGDGADGHPALSLTVVNSPFAAVAGDIPAPVCHPIIGMLRAVGSMALGGAVHVEETRCAAGGGSECRFTIRRDPEPSRPGETAYPRVGRRTT